MTTFAVYTDETYGYIVAESRRARSFAMVPKGKFGFRSRLAAMAMANKCNQKEQKGISIATRMIETPGRFEEVADTKYGVAW